MADKEVKKPEEKPEETKKVAEVLSEAFDENAGYFLEGIEVAVVAAYPYKGRLLKFTSQLKSGRFSEAGFVEIFNAAKEDIKKQFEGLKAQLAQNEATMQAALPSNGKKARGKKK